MFPCLYLFSIYVSMSLSIQHLCFHVFIYSAFMFPCLYLFIIYVSMSLSIQHLCFHVFIYSAFMFPCLYPFSIYVSMSLSIQHLCFHVFIYSAFMFPCLYLFSIYVSMSLSIQHLCFHVFIYSAFMFPCLYPFRPTFFTTIIHNIYKAQTNMSIWLLKFETFWAKASSTDSNMPRHSSCLHTNQDHSQMWLEVDGAFVLRSAKFGVFGLNTFL